MRENSRFTFSKAEREREYSSFERMVERRKEKMHEMESRVREQYARASSELTTTMIVSFQHTQSADLI